MNELPSESTRVPLDPLGAVFTPDVLHFLQATRNPSKELIRRLRILETAGRPPSHWSEFARRRHLYDRARRAAWDSYIHAAFATGLLCLESSTRLLSDLQGRNDDNFRSAISECIISWILAGKMRLPVYPKPTGRGNRTLDLGVILGEIKVNIEVKAKKKELHGDFFRGDDSGLVRQALKDANRQFSENHANILAIVPEFRIPLCQSRNQVTRALIGDSVISAPIALDSSGNVAESSPESVVFKATGALVKGLKTDGSPGFTRVSAVLSVEPFIDRRCHPLNSVRHFVSVTHNPFARYPIPFAAFNRFPQLVHENNTLFWTDNYPVTDW